MDGEDTVNVAVSMILGLVIFCTSLPIASGADYVLAPGDVLNIRVFGHEDLEIKAVEIRPDHKIDFPMVGEISTFGTTPGKLAHMLTVSLREFLRDPQVSINVDKYHTTRLYILGEINKPGLYELNKQHNLLDAIGIAGGYTKDAAKKKVFVIPGDQAKQPSEVNLLQLLQTGDAKLNISLGDGDTVFLTSNNRLDFSRDILPLISGFYYIRNLNN